MKRHCTVWAIVLLVAGCVCALPWTPLWAVVLDVGYVPLCLLGVDHWFSAGETLVLSDGTGADLVTNDPARQKEVERAKWLCGSCHCSSDWMLWVDDPGKGPTIHIRAKAWSPDRARDLVQNVVDKYRAGEGPSAATNAPTASASHAEGTEAKPHAESAEGAKVESHTENGGTKPHAEAAEGAEH